MRRGWQETVAIVLLLVGGFLWGVGWLVGVVLLWLSDVWTVRDKLIGTLVVPGGLVLPLYLAVGFGRSGSSSGLCITGPGITVPQCTHGAGTPWWQSALWGCLLVALVVASIASAVYLARRSAPARHALRQATA
jgi:hypothetical protein